MGKKKNKGLKKNKKQNKQKNLPDRKPYSRKKAKKKKPRILRKIFIGLVLWILLGVVLTNLFNFDSGDVFIAMAFIPFILVFVGAGFIMLRKSISFVSVYDDSMNPLFASEFLDESKGSNKSSSLVGTFRSPLLNTPIPYHLSLVGLTIISLLFFSDQNSIISGEYYSRFSDEFVFQVVSAVLFIILGIFNPFVEVSEIIKNRILNKQGFWYGLVSDTNRFYFFRVTICLSAIALFIYNEWLVFPSLNIENPVLIGITITLLLFVVRNLYLMQKYPKAFLKENLFRFVKLTSLMQGAIFVIVPLVPLTMLSLHLLGVNENEIDLAPFLFIAFNLVAAYLEYALIKRVDNTKTKLAK